MASKLRVLCFSISLDGYAAGPRQDLANPLGVRGPELFDWFFHTRTWQKMHKQGVGDKGVGDKGVGDKGVGETGVDDDMAARGFDNIGAWIMGRNMFGPIRGPWPDENWKGWWGEEPPYHTPVFVLTHHPRPPLRMKGGTEFRFITDGIQSALRQATDAAAGKDIRIGGGAATIRQYLKAGLIDDLHLVVSPVLLGEGEHLLHGIDTHALGYRCERHVAGVRAVAHIFLRKQA